MKSKEETSYLVFARKFRPQGFDEVVGQESIVRTLKNSIAQNRIPQNFLFSGPRGVGKTSTARIIAKALNCEKGPTDTPCGKCQSCREITLGNSMDVLEIDGASNRGIEDVKQIRENVKFKPVAGTYKIYIIDEVHMLSIDAFNALLKTLEEPPPHVKFIFATTESHKVPLTILSRCQRFNFKRIPVSEIAAKLEAIARKEKIPYEKNVLFQIAKASEGALRDAEGLLDQLVSFSEGKIKEADVLQVLGLASESVYFDAIRLLREKNAAALFEMIGKIYEEGVDLAQFAKGLFEMFRHLLLFQCADNAAKFVELSEEGLQKLAERKKDFSRGELLLALNILNSLQTQMRRNLASPRLLLEMALLKLLHVDQLQSVEKLTQQISAGVPASPSPAGFRPAASSGGYKPLTSSRPSVSAPVTMNSGKTTAASSGKNAPPAEVLVPVSTNASGPISLNEVGAVWPRVIEYVKTKKMSNGIFLSEAAPIEVDDTVVVVGFAAEFQFHKEMMEKEPAKKLVEEAFQVCLGKRAGVRFVITRPEQKTMALEEGENGNGIESVLEPQPESSKLPNIITDAMDIFDGAKIVRKDP